MIYVIYNAMPAHRSIEKFATYMEMSMWAKERGFKPSQIYNSGRARHDKRWIECAVNELGQTAEKATWRHALSVSRLWNICDKAKERREAEALSYEDLDQEAKQAGDNGYCSVISVAAALNVDYAKAAKLMADQGRQFKRGATMMQIKRAIEAGGKEMKLDAMKTTQYRRRTMNQVARILTEGKWVISMRGHVATIVDGEVMDWTKGRRHQVQHIYKVA